MRVSDQVAEQLLQLIAQLRLQSGQRLPSERQLADELGVSRTALREAIQKLSSQGILSSRVGAGTFVQAPAATHTHWHSHAISPLVPLFHTDPQYLYDVLETRLILETDTAWHAARRATRKDKTHIQHCFDALLHHQHQQDAEAAARADAQFHLAIAEASHNAVIVQIMRSLFELMRNTVAENRRVMFEHDNTKVVEQLTQHHHDILQAILHNEPDRARCVMSKHLSFVHDKLAQAEADAARLQRLGRLSPLDPSTP